MKITDEQEISRIKKLVSAAKAMISGQVGVTIGSITIKNKLIWLGIDWEEKYPIFAFLDEESNNDQAVLRAMESLGEQSDEYFNPFFWKRELEKTFAE